MASFLESPLGFSQLLFAQIYETFLWEQADKGVTLILLILALIALPSVNLCLSEPMPWCILKHSQNLCCNPFFFSSGMQMKDPLTIQTEPIFLVINSPQIKTFNRKCSLILSGIAVPPASAATSQRLNW